MENQDEINHLMALGLTAEEAASLRPSRERQKRVRYLLARNKVGNLSQEEEAELNACGEQEHAVQLIKARRLGSKNKL